MDAPGERARDHRGRYEEKRAGACDPASSGRPMAASQKATFHGLVSAIAAPSPKRP